MFDIVFVYLRVIVLVIMSEWMSRLCTFVHVCARLCTFVHELREAHTFNPKVNSVNLVGYFQFGSVWIKYAIIWFGGNVWLSTSNY